MQYLSFYKTADNRQSRWGGRWEGPGGKGGGAGTRGDEGGPLDLDLNFLDPLSGEGVVWLGEGHFFVQHVDEF